MREEVKYLRKNVYNFLKNEILKETTEQPILEIGPMCEEFTPIKKYFINTKKYFTEKNMNYISCDVYPESNCDIIDDVLNLEKHFNKEAVGTIIALEVLEHTSRIWELPEIFYNILKPGGKIFLSIPYYFYRHAPFPDYWRISEDGLKLLFADKFNISINACYKPLRAGGGGGRKPKDYTLIGIKK